MNAQLQQRPVEPGRVILDEAPETYYQRRLDEASATGLKLIDARSPAHFRYWVENTEDESETPAKAFGKAYHCAILEPNEFDKRYIVLPADAPDRPTQAMLNAPKPSPNSIMRQDWWAAWNRLAAGRSILTARDYERAMRMGDAVRSHPLASGLILAGNREATIRWQDPDTGIACKARIDYREPGEFDLDVKSAEDASPEGFARAVTNYRYDLQAAHYVAGEQACGSPVKRFFFLACESDAPFVCQLYVLDSMAEQRGWALRQRAIAKQAACLRSGRWPGYSEGVAELTLPAWAFYGTEL